MPKDQKEIISEMHTDLQWIKAKLSELDEKYAAKYIESLVKGGVGFILFSVLGALVGLIVLRPAAAYLFGL